MASKAILKDIIKILKKHLDVIDNKDIICIINALAKEYLTNSDIDIVKKQLDKIKRDNVDFDITGLK